MAGQPPPPPRQPGPGGQPGRRRLPAEEPGPWPGWPGREEEEEEDPGPAGEAGPRTAREPRPWPGRPPQEEEEDPESAGEADPRQGAPGREAGRPGPPPGWSQRPPGRRPAPRRPPNRGFLAALFDFSFTSFVTPMVIKGLYVLGTIWTFLVALFLFLTGLHFGHPNLGTFIFLVPAVAIFILVSLGAMRVTLEFFMSQYRIDQSLQELRRQGERFYRERG